MPKIQLEAGMIVPEELATCLNFNGTWKLVSTTGRCGIWNDGSKGREELCGKATEFWDMVCIKDGALYGIRYKIGDKSNFSIIPEYVIAANKDTAFRLSAEIATQLEEEHYKEIL
jgi:hypothetical protein